MEAKTMISETERGPVESALVTSVDGDHIWSEGPDVPSFELTSTPSNGPAGPSSFEPTGDERVDEALTRLGELGGVPVAQHVEVFEDVHRRLQDVLGAIDQESPGQTGPPVPRPPGPGVQPLPGRPGGG
jgi:hypothetical protein